MRTRIIFSGALLALVSSAVHAGTPLPDAPHIVVSGEGKVSVKPDSARIRFDFVQRASRPLPAKQSVDTAVNSLLGMLDAYGVENDDVAASSLNASEDVGYTDDGTRVSNGFVAERNVSVVMRQLDRLNEFLDGGLRSGADEIGSVAFESTQADSLRKDAKRKAVDSAKLKASGMAAAFGTTLGPVYSIDSVNSRFSSGFGATTLDRIEVTGTRVGRGRYIQPTVEYVESVNAVFELRR